MKTTWQAVIFLCILISFSVHAQDTLRSKNTVYIKALPDSIFINTNNRVEYRGEILTKGEALKLMKTKANARTEARMTNMFRTFAAISFVEGGVWFIDFGIGASKGAFNWIAGSVGLIDLIIAATMQHHAGKHFDKAIKLYNLKPGIAGRSGLKPELRPASAGFGINLRF